MEDEFEAAANIVRAKAGGLDPQLQLALYGLYKQATVGDCDSPQPWGLEARAKWKAWKEQRGIPSDAAKRAYVDLAATIPASQGLGIAVSTPVAQALGDDDIGMTPLMEAASEGNLSRLDALLSGEDNDPSAAAAALEATDADGRTALHWAADRGRTTTA
ncbi:hypothetical protein CTAYLR_008324 [Chrysophaeum taylorii]|uniref:ACB domain-containing protein n=1 Tax=Chrysophaeum taylorii TaxID=2483200 RepID=A0AAD7XIJ3_9STRA|nr:hypothetical protein CTAYLR_008324 [Chrysophaeum taylorii]